MNIYQGRIKLLGPHNLQGSDSSYLKRLHENKGFNYRSIAKSLSVVLLIIAKVICRQTWSKRISSMKIFLPEGLSVL